MDVNVNLSLFYVLFCFLLIFFVAKRTLFAKLDTILSERREMIEGSREAAASHEEFIDRSRAEVNAKLAEARARAYATKQELREEALKQQNGIVDSARQQATDRIGTAQKQLESTVAGARQQLQMETDALAAEIVRAVMGRTA